MGSYCFDDVFGEGIGLGGVVDKDCWVDVLYYVIECVLVWVIEGLVFEFFFIVGEGLLKVV